MEQTVFDKIEVWAEARNLVSGSNPHAQMLKLTEEVGELAAEIARGDDSFGLIEAIGSCVVVLTILSAQLELDINNCVEYAYNLIKDRKGGMENSVFIREESDENLPGGC